MPLKATNCNILDNSTKTIYKIELLINLKLPIDIIKLLINKKGYSIQIINAEYFEERITHF